MNSFYGKKNLQSELIATAIELRGNSKFANAALRARGFDSLGWLTSEVCRQSKFSKASEVLDIPQDLLFVYDYFFEATCVPRRRFATIPEEFLSALTVGLDYTEWWRSYFLSLMTHPTLSPLQHQVSPIIHDLYLDVIELYKSFDKCAPGWQATESKARSLAQDAPIYWVVSKYSKILSYEFSAAWFVARSCAFVTRYSAWWARAALFRFFDLSDAYAVHPRTIIPAAVYSPDNTLSQLYDTFLVVLAEYKVNAPESPSGACR